MGKKSICNRCGSVKQKETEGKKDEKKVHKLEEEEDEECQETDTCAELLETTNDPLISDSDITFHLKPMCVRTAKPSIGALISSSSPDDAIVEKQIGDDVTIIRTLFGRLTIDFPLSLSICRMLEAVFRGECAPKLPREPAQTPASHKPQLHGQKRASEPEPTTDGLATE